MKRKAYVAGQFYPASREALTSKLARLCEEIKNKENAKAVIAPHAGYIYSGRVAGEVYSRVAIKDTVVILCPNHTGMGSRCSVMSEGTWVIPLGEISINAELSRRLMEKSTLVRNDPSSHAYEHSLEVQLPFISYLKGTFDLLPLALKRLTIGDCRELADALADVLKESGKEATIVASTDMSHYETDSVAREKDHLAIEKILSLDPEGLYSTVEEEGISMCGYIPTTVAMMCALRLGAKEGKLVKYATSGDVSGDYQQVVGYAGIYLK
jgi:AmmeMemoRadiSam system protein B